MNRTNLIYQSTFLALLVLSSVHSQNISISICEIIENVYTKISISVDIIDFGGKQGKLIGEIMKNLNNSMAVKVKKIEVPQKWTQKLSTQSILLFDKFLDFYEFNNKDLIEMRYINPIRILIYCENTTQMEISSIKTDLVIPPYYYFIIFDKYTSEISLYTFENLLDVFYCHESQRLIKINKFTSTTSKWTTEPIFPIKYKNFHGCLMGFGVYNFTNLFQVVNETDTYTVDIFMVNLVQAIAKELNFIPSYILCSRYDCSDHDTRNGYIYNVLKSSTLDGYAVSYNDEFQFVCILLNIQCT